MEESNAKQTLRDYPGTAGAYDLVPMASASAVFTLDTSTDIFLLHSLQVPLVLSLAAECRWRGCAHTCTHCDIGQAGWIDGRRAGCWAQAGCDYHLVSKDRYSALVCSFGLPPSTKDECVGRWQQLGAAAEAVSRVRSGG